MSMFRFEKLPPLILEIKRNQRLFEEVWRAIAAQVEEAPFSVNTTRLARSPAAAQAVYWLWRFQSEAAAGGFEVFTLEALGCHAPPVHDALKMVGAVELVRRLEAAIPVARAGSAEFKKLPDQAWFKQFETSAEFPTLQSVDADVFPLIQSLTEAVAAFIRSHRGELFNGPAPSK